MHNTFPKLDQTGSSCPLSNAAFILFPDMRMEQSFCQWKQTSVMRKQKRMSPTFPTTTWSHLKLTSWNEEPKPVGGQMTLSLRTLSSQMEPSYAMLHIAAPSKCCCCLFLTSILFFSLYVTSVPHYLSVSRKERRRDPDWPSDVVTQSVAATMEVRLSVGTCKQLERFQDVRLDHFKRI